ncbi:MAG: Serine/threonine protein kinase [Modestobacter sp.]|nr:Serine/threonine protein kinase [Modestobacter sp.]
MPVPSAPSAAPVVPGYVLEELLGRGGSGQVWRARPRGGGTPVAVKVLVRGDPERQEREAALLGELDHPHLVRLHEVVRHEVRGGPAEVALVLDLLAGGSLAALLARRGRLRPGEVVTTVAPVAAALAHAHDRGVVHGDLSPGNVVFTAEGRPVLTDLGTARLVGDTARAEVTPAYVDPVVARGGAPGPASDVFGVAAAAFHALTGIAPWNAADPRGTLTVAAAGELPDLALLAPEAPEELVRVVRRGLSPEPHQRGSAAAFALDLRHACRPEPVRLPVAGVPDAELGRTGLGALTELTHQVPGRRPRAAHAAPVHAGRWARLRAGVAACAGLDGGPGLGGLLGGALRRLVVVGAVVLAVAAGLAGAAWAGASWGGRQGEPLPAAETALATGNAAGTGAPAEQSAGAPTAGPAEGAGPPSDAGAGVSVADRTTAPDDDPGWTALLTELYARRAAAFTAAEPAVLPGAYLPGSALLERDTAQVSRLVAAGQTLEGFEPQVRRLLSVTPDGEDRVVLRLIDELPGYRVVPVAGPGAASAQEVAGRGEAEVRIVVERTAVGWRISDAQVVR